MLFENYQDMVSDEISGGRSAKGTLSLFCTSHDSSPDYFDYTAPPPFPPLLPTGPRPTLLDVFRAPKRTDRFAPLSPKLTSKQQAQSHLCTARLSLLHKLGHKHRMMARVELNGALKPLRGTSHDRLYSTFKRVHQWSLDVANATSGDEQRGPPEMRTGRYEEAKKPITGRRIDWHWGEAHRAEMKRREELREEMSRRNAELEREVSALSDILDEKLGLAVVGPDEDMMFAMEIDMAVSN